MATRQFSLAGSDAEKNWELSRDDALLFFVSGDRKSDSLPSDHWSPNLSAPIDYILGSRSGQEYFLSVLPTPDRMSVGRSHANRMVFLSLDRRKSKPSGRLGCECPRRLRGLTVASIAICLDLLNPTEGQPFPARN